MIFLGCGIKVFIWVRLRILIIFLFVIVFIGIFIFGEDICGILFFDFLLIELFFICCIFGFKL